MVLYLAREYKSAGVVSRIATTRKKVEGIKRCSLLFDRERRRFLFAKRAFSRFDVLAFVLLRLFSLSFCDIFLSLCALIKSVSCRSVSSNTKKREQQQNKEKEKKKSPPKPNKQQKEERKREKKKGERLSRFRFHSHHIHHREALSLWRLESRLRWQAILLSKAPALLGTRFAEKERENLRVFLEGRTCDSSFLEILND